MNAVIYSTIVCLAIVLLIAYSYFTKKRVKTDDNLIFKRVLILLILVLFLEIIGILMPINNDVFFNIKIILKKLYLFTVLFWGVIFCIFCSSAQRQITKKTMQKIILVTNTIFAIAITVSPLKFVINQENIATNITGIGYYIFLTFMLLQFTYIVYFSIRYRKKLGDKKKPITTLIVMMLSAGIIQMLIPEFLLMTFSMTIITVSMYLNIENPDIKMLKQVELAKDTAEKANRAKTDFLSSMSHEIRTPLNAIVGFSQMIETVDQLDEAKENAKDVISAANTLLEIVNGILDISKIEAGKMEIVNTNYKPTKLFEEIIKLLNAKIQSKSIEFNIKIAPDLPEVLYGDVINLKKIITNLLSNAYKYTDYGFINFSVSCINANDICRLMINIEDSGRGIKEEDINKLFTKFNRLDVDKNTTTEGTGLGLAITKQLTELMGGKILVDSKFGEGSKFTVIINQRINKIEPIQNESLIYDKIDLKDKNILIVDDNPLNLKVAEKLLKKYGPIITTVDNGFDCIKLVKEKYFDLILLDDMMPKLSGKETFEQLKKMQGFNSIVIVLTANAIHGMEEKYLNLGFNGYIAKPIELNKMIKTIEKSFYYKTNNKINFGDLPNEIYEINQNNK